MKKTENQTAFDGSQHGWAFADARGLARRITVCEEIAERLSVRDLRHHALKLMKEKLLRLQKEEQT